MKEQAAILYRLTKPGIVYGNAIHIAAGCLFAYRYGISFAPVVGVIIGTSLVIASACVANNYIDRDIDAQMKRTQKRSLVTGAMSTQSAIIYSVVLLIVGFAILAILTNLIVCAIGVIAYIFYVFIYAWAKRTTVHSTLVGSIPGALPAMAGYVAISGTIDGGALLLFALIVVWQMPHFYAISLFRKNDYAKAKLPVLGVVAPSRVVVRQMRIYIVLYCAVMVSMIVYGYFGLVAGGVMLLAGLWWLMQAFRRPKDENDVPTWARKVFGRSLILSLLLFIMSGLNIVLP